MPPTKKKSELIDIPVNEKKRRVKPKETNKPSVSQIECVESKTEESLSDSPVIVKTDDSLKRKRRTGTFNSRSGWFCFGPDHTLTNILVKDENKDMSESVSLSLVVGDILQEMIKNNRFGIKQSIEHIVKEYLKQSIKVSIPIVISPPSSESSS